VRTLQTSFLSFEERGVLFGIAAAVAAPLVDKVVKGLQKVDAAADRQMHNNSSSEPSASSIPHSHSEAARDRTRQDVATGRHGPTAPR
jgi:hypothetical protein